MDPGVNSDRTEGDPIQYEHHVLTCFHLVCVCVCVFASVTWTWTDVMDRCQVGQDTAALERTTCSERRGSII